MIKTGINENEKRKIEAKIEYLEKRIHDDKGLTKEEGGNVSVSVIDWDNEYIYFGIKVKDILKHTLHYPLTDFLN